MSVQIVVPTLGESVSEATVAQWLKQVGDRVDRDEPVVELETDKVTLEVNAPVAGTLSDILAAAGETVQVGAVLGELGEAGAAAATGDGRAAEPDDERQGRAADGALAETADAPGTEIVVPALGESVTEGTVARWLKQAGDTVAQDEPVVELETDKVTLEVNAPVAGTLVEQRAAEGDTVAVGAILGVIGGGKPATAAAPKTASATETVTSGAPSAGPAPGDADAILMPAARKMVEEHGLDPTEITGTGKGGRITKEDVQQAIDRPSGQTAPEPALSSPSGETTSVAVPVFQRPSGDVRPRRELEERVRMSKLRRTIASRLKQAQNTAAMLTTFNEVDMTALMAVRNAYKDGFEKKHSVRLGFMSFFAKAAVAALQEIPAVNAEIDGEEIVYKNYYDIGVAVGTPQGLVVPVVRDVDQLSFAEIEGTIAALGRKARDGKLSMAEMTGGTFTISNGGVYGSLMSTPILNPPQSGILGMHKVQQRPMVVNGEIKARPMMYLALSYDHRIIDGSEAVTFLVRVKEAIEDPQRLLLGV